MFRVIIFFLILNFYNPAQTSINDKIILKLKQTNNLSFYFKQSNNEKNENGNCIIKYPKKIYYEYKGQNKKLLCLMVNL